MDGGHLRRVVPADIRFDKKSDRLRWLARVVGGVFQSICILIKTKPAGGLGW